MDMEWAQGSLRIFAQKAKNQYKTKYTYFIAAWWIYIQTFFVKLSYFSALQVIVIAGAVLWAHKAFSLRLS